MAALLVETLTTQRKPAGKLTGDRLSALSNHKDADLKITCAAGQRKYCWPGLTAGPDRSVPSPGLCRCARPQRMPNRILVRRKSAR
jgi:hypothetical protein